MLPSADAMIVVPATFSTINKWAAGISDTLALGLINEAIGMSLPIVAVPHVNAPLARHPALAASFATLRGAGDIWSGGMATMRSPVSAIAEPASSTQIMDARRIDFMMSSFGYLSGLRQEVVAFRPVLAR